MVYSGIFKREKKNGAGVVLRYIRNIDSNYLYPRLGWERGAVGGVLWAMVFLSGRFCNVLYGTHRFQFKNTAVLITRIFRQWK